MTKSSLAFVLAILTATAGSTSAIDLAKWQYVADVNVGIAAGEYRVLTTTPEIYNVARTDLEDLRLIDRDGNQIPYIFTRDEEKAQTVKYNPAIFNQSTDADGNVLVTLDFGSQTIKNSIEVETTGDNFRRAVRVEGSNDNVKFFTIVERAYVFAVSAKDLHRFNAIELPNNDYRYLRITVSPMSAEETPPRIKEVRAFKVEKKQTEKQAVEMTQTEKSEDVNNRTSIYTYDLKFRRLPIVEIDLNIEDDSFYRCVTIQGRNSETEKVKVDSEDNRARFTEVAVPWNAVATDTIYRYTDLAGKNHQKLTLSITSGRSYRYMRIIVSNYDDRPITILSAWAKMIPHKLVFPATSDKSAKLYVGCDDASHPQYDLARRLTDGTQVKVIPAAMTALADNPLFAKTQQKLPWTEQHKTLLLVVLVAVVAVMGVFMLKSVKTIQKQEGSN